jgi:Family of unknown function (DUF6399)
MVDRWSTALSSAVYGSGESAVSRTCGALSCHSPVGFFSSKIFSPCVSHIFQAELPPKAGQPVVDRNGSLSQMQHNHRGLPTRRYPVWTALHNFDCRATDGTTPASRFFRRSFPDLFESVLSQIDELPMPRQRRQALAATH